MELNKYVGKWVKIDLKNGFYYEGAVERADDDCISLIDKRNNLVDISVEAISYIVEVSR